MSVLRRLVKGRTVEETVTNYTVGPSFSNRSRAGVDVSRESAMRHAAVWACVRLRAETIGMLPVSVVEYDGDTRKAVDGPAWLERPNPEMTRFDLFERTSSSLDIDGNAFWWLERDNLGRITEVWPLPPSRVTVFRDAETQERRFRVADDKDSYGSEQVFHIPGFTLPGRLRGLSPIEQHASAIGLALAAEEYGEQFFSNGVLMSGVITAPDRPSPTEARFMQDSFARDHRGLRNAHRPGFLFGGASWTPLSMANDAAQFLETRRYQVSEIARIFRVPPHKIGDLDRATFSNIEHQAIEWVTDGVLPYTTRIEAAVVAAGFLDRGQRLKFNMAGLLRGDTTTMYQAFTLGRNGGWLSVDDIRALLDLNPLPDGNGQVYLQPLNMAEATAATVPFPTPPEVTHAP
jgi:HK97 family phage portal protein